MQRKVQTPPVDTARSAPGKVTQETTYGHRVEDARVTQVSFLMPDSPSGEAQGCTTSKKKSGRGEDTFIDKGQGMQAPTTTKTLKLQKRKSEPKATATISATPTLAAPKPPHKKRRGRPLKNLNKTQ